MQNKLNLKDISLISEIEEITLTPSLIKLLKKEDAMRSKQHAACIRVYRIIYKSKGHSIVGFIVEPLTKKGSLPCIIWNRGGDRFSAGIQPQYIFSRSIGALATAGYIVFASQYSGNEGGEGTDYHGGAEIEDVLTFHKIIQRYSYADSKRIGMYGISRGGTMCYLALARVKWIRAVVVTAGVSNFFHQVKHRPGLRKLYRKLFGGSREEYKKRSVVYWVDKLYKKAPLLLLHGTADRRVDVRDTLELGKLFYEAKIPYRVVIYPGEDHGISGSRASTLNETIGWFDQYVKNLEKLPNLKLRDDE